MNMVSPGGRPRVALIAGPTASGKSALGLALAEREGGTIINADASQVYRDLRILTARPSAEEEAHVPHRLFGYRDGAEACSAADWAADARAAIDAVVGEGRVPILVGGTGFYLRTLLDGVAPVPPIDPGIRADVRALDAAAAWQALQREDTAAAARLHPNDRARLQRALEVVRSTGRSIGEWQRDRVGGIREQIALDVTIVMPPVSELYARCDARAAAIIELGALGEVAALMARGLDGGLPVMHAIGVRPLADHLAAQTDLPAAIATLQRQTRNYAKRQRTWFTHQPLAQNDNALRNELYVTD